MPSCTKSASRKKSDTRPERQLAIVTASALMRAVEQDDWSHIAVLARSILRTAADAMRVEGRTVRAR